MNTFAPNERVTTIEPEEPLYGSTDVARQWPHPVHQNGQAASNPGLSTSDQHVALLEIGKSIALCRDLEELFDDLARHLGSVLTFDYLNLVLHDSDRNVMRMRVLACDESPTGLVGLEFPVDASPAGLVWQTQEPMVIDDVASEVRFPQVTACLMEHGIQSACVLPLTTTRRRLGALGIGSRQTGVYARTDIEFLQLVAAQTAVAVDNALYHEEARLLHRQLAQERDRLQSLLDLNNAAVSNLEMDDLFRAISARLRRLMKCDYASLLLPEPDGEQLRLYGLDFPDGEGFLREGLIIPIEGSPSGTAFRTLEPQVLGVQDFAGLAPDINPIVAEALQTGCFLPLVSRNRALGALNLGWRQETSLSKADVTFLSDVARQVAIAVENATNYRHLSESSQRLAVEKLYLEEEIRSEHNFEEIVGSSPALMRVLGQIQSVAPTDSTVLLEGETGTGKEVIARAIHNLSSRKDRTFVKLNCAAIPTGLLESELFGHEKGAFTGAIAQKLGRFELADKGTLFLDEVGDIPAELQPKLLRVLQEQEFERLGSTRTQRVNVRVIAATNHDLAQAVNDKEFRSDLYYRLNVFPVKLPPLRERTEDIEPLTRHFVQKYARQMKKDIQSISHRAMVTLLQYQWPGNVRELEHFIERAVIMSRGTELEPPVAELAPTSPLPDKGPQTYREAERDTILRALEESNWIVGGPRGAAARLGLGRTTLQYKMQKLGLVRFRAAASRAV